VVMLMYVSNAMKIANAQMKQIICATPYLTFVLTVWLIKIVVVLHHIVQLMNAWNVRMMKIA